MSNTNTVLNTTFDPLPLESRVQGFTHRAKIRYDLLTTTVADDTQTFTATIPANARIADVLLDLKVPFVNSASVANNHTTVQVGDSGSATQFLTATEINGVGLQTFADGATATSTALTSATAAFTAADVGRLVTGSGIPAATTIASVTNATTVVLSAATTATATGVSISIAGRGPIPFKAMSGSAKTYLAADSLKLLVTPASGTALTALTAGSVDVYVKLQLDGELG